MELKPHDKTSEGLSGCGKAYIILSSHCDEEYILLFETCIIRAFALICASLPLKVQIELPLDPTESSQPST